MQMTTNKSEISKPRALFRVLALLVFYNIVFGVGILWGLQQIGFSGVGASLIASQASIFILFLAYFKFDTNEIKKVLTFDIDKKQVSLVIIFTAIFLVLNIIIGMITPDPNVAEYSESTTQKILGTNNILIMVFFPVIIAPIVEELAFRAGFKKVLVDQGGWSNAFYVIVSGLTFGLLHLQPGVSSLAAVGITGSIGLLNAILYLNTKNIFAPILSHMLYNLCIMLIALSGS